MTQQAKMTPTDAIVRMINAVNQDSDADFYRIVHEYADTLTRGGGARSRIVSAVNLKPTRLRRIDQLPSTVKNLLIQGGNKDENVFLIDSVRECIDTLLLEWENAELYRMHNISPRSKLLLHGPTGNGKTTIARYIARKSGLPFVEINSDLVIDSKLGGTSTNIHSVLSSINEPCVLFWDEVDSIGRKRGGRAEAASYENDRMVNSILINLQKMDDNVIFIGATNRMDVLDSAFLRRFDVKLEIPAPTWDQLCEFTIDLIQYYGLTSHINPSIRDIKSYSDAKLRVTEEARKYLLKSIEKQQQTA